MDRRLPLLAARERRQLSRRAFLRTASLAGAATPALGVLLLGCGGPQAQPTAAPAASAAASSPTLVPTALPVAPQVSPAAASPAAVTAASPVAAASPAAAAERPVVGGKLTWGNATEPPGLDPGGLSNVPAHTVTMQMYDSLLAMDTNFNIHPWLATSWKLSDDQKSYIFTLRRDVKFHDGTPFNARAVKVSIDRIKDPKVKSTSATAILGPLYEGTEVVDDYTVKVNFKQPYAPFLGGCTTAFMGMVSPAAVEKYGEDFPLNPVGTGPYIFKEWVQKERLVMTRNPDYKWAAPIFKNTGPSYLEEITIRFVPEAAARQAMLDTGEAQFIDTVPPQNVARLRQNTNQQLLIAQRPGGPKMTDLNTKKAPLDQLEVRQALNHAINKEDIVRTVLFGVFRVAGSPLAPPTFGYDPATENQYPYNPQRAAELLDKAGWKVGAGGLREKDGQPFKLECLIAPTEEDKALAQLMQAQLKPLGIEVNIQEIAGPALTAAKQQGQHHIGYKIAVYQDPDILGIYFNSRSIGGFNFTFYEDKDLDGLYDRGIATIDTDQRKRIYAQAQKELMDKALLVPIYYLANISAASGKLQGVFPDTGGYFWFYDAWLRP